MPRWNGGVIGAANNPTTSSAKGIWSLSEATKAIRAGLWPAPNAGADPYFENVTLLLPGNGTNGAQNNTFLDSSTNAFTITRNGNTTQGTFTPFSKPDGRWSNYFDGSGDYFTTPSNAALAFGSSNFTLEFWIYATSFPSTDGRPLGNASSWAANAWSLHNDHTSYNEKFSFWVNNYSSGSAMLVSTSSSTLNTWHHVAVTRDGNTWRMFVNGALEATQTSSVAMDGGSSDDMFIGGSGAAGEYIGGYLSNVRAVKGTAVYTAAFTTPTAPLTAITNTSLLTCQSNRFIDNSTNAFAITRNGDVSVQTFSPFPSLTAYAAGTNGGSGYFDGSGDYLSAASNAAFAFGTGDFTVEAYLYLLSYPSSGVRGIVDTGASVNAARFGLSIYSSGYVYVDNNTNLLSSSTTQLPLNQWVHLAVSRSGTTMRMFFNGTQVASGTVSTNFSDSNLRIGATIDNLYWLGYISDARIVKGTAVYTAAFTPPTAPLTAISNTSLLLSYTNGGIVDAAMSNDLETVGNAQISTTQSKFGGSSISLDGTGDWLLFPAGDRFAFGTGDYTVEAWLYFTSISSSVLQIIFMSGSTAGNTFYFHADGDQLSVGTSSAFISNQATTFSTNTWYHVAACRAGTTLRLFVNGTQIGSNATDSTNWISSGSARVGSNESGAQTFYGYIDDLRVTKGHARYTANFTAPVGAFVGFGD